MNVTSEIIITDNSGILVSKEEYLSSNFEDITTKKYNICFKFILTDLETGYILYVKKCIQFCKSGIAYVIEDKDFSTKSGFVSSSENHYILLNALREFYMLRVKEHPECENNESLSWISLRKTKHSFENPAVSLPSGITIEKNFLYDSISYIIDNIEKDPFIEYNCFLFTVSKGTIIKFSDSGYSTECQNEFVMVKRFLKVEDTIEFLDKYRNSINRIKEEFDSYYEHYETIMKNFSIPIEELSCEEEMSSLIRA